jgi:hypothetical protein
MDHFKVMDKITQFGYKPIYSYLLQVTTHYVVTHKIIYIYF